MFPEHRNLPIRAAPMFSQFRIVLLIEPLGFWGLGSREPLVTIDQNQGKNSKLITRTRDEVLDLYWITRVPGQRGTPRSIEIQFWLTALVSQENHQV